MAVAGSLGLFALLRLPWTEAWVVLPLTAAQATVAAAWFGAPAVPVLVTPACSGADAMALSLSAIVAYPVAWARRLFGAAGAACLILALNTVRIGTLGLAAGSPSFDGLHLYVWPAVLTVTAALYVFGWMRVADRRGGPPAAAGARLVFSLERPWRRFIALAIVFLVAFVLAAPVYLESRAGLAVAGVIASGVALILTFSGVAAHASANILWMQTGGVAVTQECIATPLIPIYLAMVAAYAPTARRAAFGVAAALPLFVALGVARLLLVALPAVAAPLFWVHSFYQVVAAAAVVCVVAFWRHQAAGGRRASAAVAMGVLCGIVLGPMAARAIALAGVMPPQDSQGAIALLLPFQLAFYVALCVAAARATGVLRLTAGLTVLGLSAAATMVMLRVMATDAGFVPHVRDIRAWSIVAPMIVAAVVMRDARARR